MPTIKMRKKILTINFKTMNKMIGTGLLILGVFSASAQNKQAQIDAKVPGFFNGNRVFLKNSKGKTLDSAKVENGQFRFLTKIDEPIFVNIYLKKDTTVLSDKFYIQPGIVKVTAVFNKDHKITEKNISRTGATEVQDKWVAYNTRISSIQDSVRKTQSRHTSAFGQKDTTIRWKLKQEIDQLNKEKKNCKFPSFRRIKIHTPVFLC
jgi:hypothetical protein